MHFQQIKFILVFILVGMLSSSLKPDNAKFSVLLVDYSDGLGHMRSILVDQNSITFFTNCDYEYDSCKGATKTLYERKLTRAESSGYYNFLRKLNLKDIQGKFEDPNDNSGYQINITVSGDELMRREITLYNATFAQTDSIIQKTNDLIADEKYKFFLKK